MAKNSVRDYSATAALNTDIDGIDIDEGCAPSGINNALRASMSHIKDVSTGAVALESPAADSLSVTGNITVSGTVDGRDVAADGTKLDGIEASATADQTGSEIATALNGETLTGIASATVTGDLTVDTNTLHVDSTNDRVGIGTTSPAEELTVDGNIQLLGTTYTDFSDYWGVDNNSAFFTPYGYLGSNGSFTVSLYSNGYRNSSGGFTYMGINGNTTTASGIDLNPNGLIQFKTGTASATILPERMRIDSSGNVLVGATSNAIGNVGFKFNSTGFARSERSGTSAQGHIVFTNANGDRGSITTNSTSTQYNTTSDYRLKENAVAISDGITRVKSLQPKRFNFIVDDSTTVDGFMAHEAATVVPEAITGTHDETRSVTNAVLSADGKLLAEDVLQADWIAGKLATTDDDGNAVDALYPSDSTWAARHDEPVYQSIDQSKLVPLLTAALQEAITKIEDLEARVSTLEGN